MQKLCGDRNTKMNMGQKNLTPPSIRIGPLFEELKKGDLFYPPPSRMDQCLLLSNFFFERIPYINCRFRCTLNFKLMIDFKIKSQEVLGIQELRE